MKVQFSKEVRFVPTWRGNDKAETNAQVLVYLSPLTMGELLQVLDAMREANFQSGTQNDLSTDQMRVIMKQAGDFIPAHVTKLEGAENFKIDDVVKYCEFFGLAVEIIFELVRISSPSQADVKN